MPELQLELDDELRPELLEYVEELLRLDPLLDERLLDERLLDERLLDERLLDERLLDERLLDELLLDELLLDELLLDELLLDELLLDELLLDELLLDELLLDELLLDELLLDGPELPPRGGGQFWSKANRPRANRSELASNCATPSGSISAKQKSKCNFSMTKGEGEDWTLDPEMKYSAASTS